MVEIIYKDIQENKKYEEVITKVLEKCYEIEGLKNSKLDKEKIDYSKIVKYYKRKLVDYGAMKELKNSCKSQGQYIKKLKEVA